MSLQGPQSQQRLSHAQEAERPNMVGMVPSPDEQGIPVPSLYQLATTQKAPERQVGRATPGRGTKAPPHTLTHRTPHRAALTCHTQQTTGPPCGMGEPLESERTFSCICHGIKIFDKSLESHPPWGPSLPPDPTKPAPHTWPLKTLPHWVPKYRSFAPAIAERSVGLSEKS